MAVRTVIRMGHPVLRRVAEPVERFDTLGLHALVEDLWDTMHASGGIGIAAPQIAVARRVVVFGLGERGDEAGCGRPAPIPPTVLVNPVIEPLADAMADGWEACLSVPGLRGVVPRYTRIRYTGFDAFGNRIEREVEDYHARVVQHECDHLDGVLYPARIREHVHVRVRRGAGRRGLSGTGDRLGSDDQRFAGRAGTARSTPSAKRIATMPPECATAGSLPDAGSKPTARSTSIAPSPTEIVNVVPGPRVPSMKRYARSAVHAVSSRKSSGCGRGWRVAADSSWGTASRIRRSMSGSVSASARTPSRTRAVVSASAPIPARTVQPSLRHDGTGVDGSGGDMDGDPGPGRSRAQLPEHRIGTTKAGKRRRVEVQRSKARGLPRRAPDHVRQAGEEQQVRFDALERGNRLWTVRVRRPDDLHSVRLGKPPRRVSRTSTEMGPRVRSGPGPYRP